MRNAFRLTSCVETGKEKKKGWLSGGEVGKEEKEKIEDHYGDVMDTTATHTTQSLPQRLARSGSIPPLAMNCEDNTQLRTREGKGGEKKGGGNSSNRRAVCILSPTIAFFG